MTLSDQRRVIVSLTTISSRVKHLDTVVSALLAQDYAPSKVVVNISNHPYLLDDGVEFTDLPPLVRQLAVEGKIEIAFVRNIGSYRKLMPTLRSLKGTDCLIITADDDATYPRRWIRGLVDAFEKYGCVAAYRCRFAPKRDNTFRPYVEWSLINDYDEPGQREFYLQPHMTVFPTGRGGVLYHPSFFPELALLEIFRQLAPAQDDLAFRMATLQAGIPVIAVPIADSGTSARDFGGPPVSAELWKQNLPISGGVSENDKALQALMEYCSARNFTQGGTNRRSEI